MSYQAVLCDLIEYAKTHHILDEHRMEEQKEVLFSLFNEPVQECKVSSPKTYEQIMHVLLKRAYELNLYPIDTIDEMDAFEAKIIDILMPTPTDVKATFKNLYDQSPKKATDYLYRLSQDVNYIKVKRLKENVSWTYRSRYGQIGLTINLAKPEKDPRDIAKAKDLDHSNSRMFVPKCVICKENERNYYNARMNLRMVPLVLGDETWHFQYSPYQYYNEHAIILHDEHKPMKINEKTFTYLFDFVDQFNSYFIGSNADLPIVGGSILNHDHFQAGKYKFPIEDAKVLYSFEKDECEVQLLKWPLSTIRIRSANRYQIEKLGRYYHRKWLTYENQDLDIIPKTEHIYHQTITPIVRKKKNIYELDLILRNNRTNETYPDGIFHPHHDVWHIKKENIGLIEAMGLAILPGRLKLELQEIKECINFKNEPTQSLEKHIHWLDMLKKKYLHITEEDLLIEVGKIFERVLEDAGVFKQNRLGINALKEFMNQIKKR